MDAREETLEILKSKFGLEDAYKVLDYFESRLRGDVATQKDIYELKLAIEKVRADLSIKIEENRSEIERVRASLLKWSFGFWFTQIAILVGILLRLLS